MVRQILFNTDMVRAILAGRKTVTRRLIKPQPLSRLCYTFAAGRKKDIGKWGYPSKETWKSWGEDFRLPEEISQEELERIWTPPCHTDDILYVRETWAPMYRDETSDEVVGYLYRADPTGEKAVQEYDRKYPEGKDYTWEGKWKPSIHMPKEAARIWLKVTNVRTERLQDMSLEDCRKEGVKLSLSGMMEGCKNDGILPKAVHDASGAVKEISGISTSGKAGALEPFRRLWDATIKAKDLSVYGWDANPYVWVVEFDRIEK